MNQLKTLVVLASILVFAAGAVVGMIARRPAATAAPKTATVDQSFLATQLQLTPEQAEKMRQIFADLLMKAGPPPVAKMKAIEAQREQAIRALLRPEQLPQFDLITDDARKQTQALHDQVRDKMRAAREQTRAVLNPRQLEQFEKLMPPD